ncbi:MAG: TRAM domain-containing protein [Myxococcaceae bacterium]|nr:TRAM domain-containing protein [Myxococcaceae bacterium]
MIDLVVDRLSKSGDGVAQHEGRTVFIEGALPGERVRVRLIDGKVLKGELAQVLSSSAMRREPGCALAEQCGGCSWLHLGEQAQRQAKEEIVCSTLEHIGGIGRFDYALQPTVFGEKQMGYRRRASMVAAHGGLGFHGRRSHLKVRVDHCPALVPELDAVLPQLAGLKDVDEVRLLAEGKRVGVSLHLRGPVKPGNRAKAEQLLARLASVVLVPPVGSPPEVFGDRRLRADVFAQANAEVNEKLVAAAAAALGAEGAALELYAGSGNFTRALVPPVTAVEVAGADAPLPSVRWVRGDVEKVVIGLLAEKARFSRLLLDPPRAGAPGVARWASGFGASRVVYVACDPASLSRDAADLKKAGYRPRSLQLFDMFPQTHHVEALMTFER